MAHYLHRRDQKVLVIDSKGIASGGSGAAGAFISPKVGKGSALQHLTNEAFAFAVDFYQRHTPNHFYQTGIVRLPKDDHDAKRFELYAPYHYSNYQHLTPSTLQSQGIHTPYEGIYFPEAGDCDAQAVCESLLEGIEVVIEEIEAIYQEESLWRVGAYRAKRLVLATGYREGLVDREYMGVRATWGTRGDYIKESPFPLSLHQSLSIGASRGGVIKIGATHEKGIKMPIPCDLEALDALKKSALLLLGEVDLRLSKSYCGMRAGSRDYFPLVGGVIDVEQMLTNHPKLKRGTTPPLVYKEGLFILGGFGGRGFVFAPMMAQWLGEHLLDGRVIDSRISPDRLFYKWCRKLHHEKG
jgi:tRNA 5-methylaminomethyl-2-thiouridine biosynthesis bifunctional protein